MSQFNRTHNNVQESKAMTPDENKFAFKTNRLTLDVLIRNCNYKSSSLDSIISSYKLAVSSAWRTVSASDIQGVVPSSFFLFILLNVQFITSRLSNAGSRAIKVGVT